jgi:hypothetical protein
MGRGLRVGVAVQSVREGSLIRTVPVTRGGAVARFETVPIGELNLQLIVWQMPARTDKEYRPGAVSAGDRRDVRTTAAEVSDVGVPLAQVG